MAKLPTVVAVLGRSAEDAAPPLLDLLSGDRVEYAGVSRPRLLAQAARTGVRRLRGVALDRPQQTVTEVPDRPSSLGGASTGSATGLSRRWLRQAQPPRRIAAILLPRASSSTSLSR